MTEIKQQNQNERKSAGRPPKTDKALHRVTIRFNSSEYADFKADLERSEVKSITHYIKGRLKNEIFRVLKADKNTLEFYHKLQDIQTEINKIGVNYNQLVMTLKKHFTEEKATKITEKTVELLSEILVLNERAMRLTYKLIQKWLPK